MKKQILLFAALCLVFSVSATKWTVTNTDAVNGDASPYIEGVHSGSLKYCVSNMLENDTVIFAPSLSGDTILFNEELITPAYALTIDASMLAENVIFDGKETSRIMFLGVSNTVKGRLYTIRNITFKNGKNTTGTAHAAALTAYNDLLIEKCNFINNVGAMTTGNVPGALYQARRNTVNVIRDCVFNGNKSAYRGGAASFAQAQALFERCYFTANEAVGSAGGNPGAGAVLYMPDLQGPDSVGTFVEFRNCTMTNNYGSGIQGTVIYNGTAYTDVSMTTLRPTYSYLRLINCTVFGNSCSADEAIGRSAIYSSYRKIQVGGCLMANNNLESNNAADIRMANVEPLVSLGYNTYNNIRHWSSMVRDEYKHASDSIYTNLQWYNAPLASLVNDNGVMIPIKTDESLFNSYIQRIPLDTLKKWHGESPVDQLGIARTNFGSVGTYQIQNATSLKSMDVLNNKIIFDGSSLTVKNAEGCRISIYNLNGIQLYTEAVKSNGFIKDMSAYTKGIYVIRLMDGIRNPSVHKIIK